tara:strand:- start:196 stop:381 length:186 start_codon:yes stop_codon:yes gene_type:complete
MKWLFVLIAVNQQGNPEIVEKHIYSEIVECYQVKNYVLESLGTPFNYQTVCIPIKDPKENE